ncbi:hypothetical protein D3C80_1152790 [compost metagenome]
MQIACVGVQQCCLPGDGFNHLGMSVADVTNIVKTIEIRPPVIVDKPGAFSAYKFYRFGIGNRQVGQQDFFAFFDNFRPGATILMEGFWWNTCQFSHIRE